MTQPIPMPRVMRADEFEAAIKDRAKFTHEIKFSEHLLKERLNDRGISIRQVINTLRKGAITSLPKWDVAKASHIAEMTYCSAGRQITVVCAIRRSSVQIIAVTAW